MDPDLLLWDNIYISETRETRKESCYIGRVRGAWSHSTIRIYNYTFLDLWFEIPRAYIYFIKNDFLSFQNFTYACVFAKDMFVSLQLLENREGVRCPVAGITDGCESPDLSAGHWTLVLSRNSMHSFNYWAILFIPGGLYFLRNIETQSVPSMNLGAIILLCNEHREYIPILFWSKAVLFFSIRNWDRRNIWRKRLIGHFLTAWRNYSYTWNWVSVCQLQTSWKSIIPCVGSN